MTGAEHDPWWASEASPGGGCAESGGADPVEAHRAARRGHPSDEDAHEDADDAHDVDVCGVCPICVALRALGDSRPELLAHLLEAARHLTAAARTLLDEHASGDATTTRGADPGHDHVTRIDLD